MTSLTRRGLRLLSQFASSPTLDRLHLRHPTETLLFQGSKVGFQAAMATTRAFKALQHLRRPQRLAHQAGGDLFDLRPTHEQVMMVDAMKMLAQAQLRPSAPAADSACMAPPGLLDQAASLGITALGIPEPLGGAGTDSSGVTHVLIAEALAHGDMGLAWACLAPSAVSTALVRWGDADQQARYLPSFAADEPPPAALAILEPHAMFDPTALQTRARRDGEGFVIDGLKSMVPSVATAELFLVAAHVEGEGPALLLVESSTPGLGFHPEPAMGLRAAACGQLALQNVRVPAAARLADGSARAYAECIALSRLGWCALAVGTAQAVLDHVVPYVNEREAFGEPISHRQSVAFAVADMAIELEGMRLLTWRAASLADAGQPFQHATLLARRQCAEQGMQIGSQGVQLLGGHGFIKEHPVERWYRDLRAVAFMEGGLLI